MKKAIITGLAGILLVSLTLNAQSQDKNYIKSTKDSIKYEESWEGHAQETPYMKYKRELEMKEEVKRSKHPDNKKDSAIYHIIQKGDTYYMLADLYWETVQEADEIEKLNPNINPNKLKIGQKIRVK